MLGCPVCEWLCSPPQFLCCWHCPPSALQSVSCLLCFSPANIAHPRLSSWWVPPLACSVSLLFMSPILCSPESQCTFSLTLSFSSWLQYQKIKTELKSIIEQVSLSSIVISSLFWSLYLHSSRLATVDIILWLVFVFIPLNVLVNYCAAIIIILKHATTLRASGLSVLSALCQAESNYHQFNIGPQIVDHFSAPPHHYSIQDFVDFVMGVSVGLLLHYQDNI